jgi:hypothetical protein
MDLDQAQRRGHLGKRHLQQAVEVRDDVRQGVTRDGERA